jgi:hypothetical protein
VRVVNDVFDVQSDGARFAWAKNWRNRVGDVIGVLVFDTLSGRRFRLAAPAPKCFFASIGGDLAAWSCYGSSPSILLTDLLTGESRPPAGLDRVERELVQQRVWYACPALAIGRHWLQLSCGSSIGPRTWHYLNHRSGRLTKGYDEFPVGLPFIDLDYVDLFRRPCAPLDGAPLTDYQPPFGLQWGGPIRLRRCGTQRVESLSRCLLSDCRTPQLGSRYVTWGEHKRVYAYLPRIRRRVLVGRAPADFVRGRTLLVAHTCNRVFARWGDSVYVARFEPRRGAPACQSAQ